MRRGKRGSPNVSNDSKWVVGHCLIRNRTWTGISREEVEVEFYCVGRDLGQQMFQRCIGFQLRIGVGR